MRIEIETTDGTLTASPAIPEFVAFEREYGKTVEALEDEARIEYLMFLAHRALVRQGDVEDDFDTFLATVRGVDSPDEVDDEDPTGESKEA